MFPLGQHGDYKMPYFRNEGVLAKKFIIGLIKGKQKYYPYLPDKGYLKEQLDIKICEIIFVNKLIKQFVEEACTEDAPQLIAETVLKHQEAN